ncbi:sigma-70 family RNA polymerase sigma factor [Bremerella sp. T1]|uniref:sigma-70 family RNA polymerase sigma factor n=1 Tax=Bremerella sp. TYQ1 TaxID=3119568 RepID=UPI001CCDC41F|nr:sigma-70 family RNA polymerase sigma factor [Bremerella volcania]UBM35394.1 sigma-70 family RNA polymerase sigma factor [Bremerella volcania]
MSRSLVAEMESEIQPPSDSSETDEKPLSELWPQAEPVVKGFLLAALPQPCDADDVLQEVAVEAARRFADYDRSRPFPPWVLWIAKIKTADFFRRTYRDRHLFLGEALEPLAEAACRTFFRLEEQSDALDVCLSKLPPKSRRLIELRYFDNLNQSQIAEEMNTSSGTIRVLLHRVRAVLAECIQRNVRGGANDEGE